MRCVECGERATHSVAVGDFCDEDYEEYLVAIGRKKNAMGKGDEDNGGGAVRAEDGRVDGQGRV